MFRTTIAFHKRLMRGETPVSYIIVHTHMGYRAYAEKELGQIFDVTGLIADGSTLADGSELAGAGSIGVIDKSGRVLSYGTLSREMQPAKDSILGAFQTKTLQSFSVELDNSDGTLSRLISLEPFIGRGLSYYMGFEDLPFNEHLKLFEGIITELSVLDVMTIEAEEE